MNQSYRPPRPLCVTLECIASMLFSFFMLWMAWNSNLGWLPFTLFSSMLLFSAWIMRGYWRGDYRVWKYMVGRCFLLDQEKKYYTDEMVEFFNVPRFVVKEFRRKHPA